MPDDSQMDHRRRTRTTWIVLGALTLASLLVYPTAGWLWDQVLGPHPAAALVVACALLIAAVAGLVLLWRRRNGR